jgi:deoxyxylulose-5-phosphate synthase
VLLESVRSPADLRQLDPDQLVTLAAEIREFIVGAVSASSGHLGSNLGAVELTLALHRVFDSPRDVILWDTGHQAYVHKIVTDRQEGFATLRRGGRPVRLSVEGRVDPRLGGKLARLDDSFLCPRTRRGGRAQLCS